MERDGQGGKGPVQKARLLVKGGDRGMRSEDDEDAEGNKLKTAIGTSKQKLAGFASGN